MGHLYHGELLVITRLGKPPVVVSTALWDATAGWGGCIFQQRESESLKVSIHHAIITCCNAEWNLAICGHNLVYEVAKLVHIT
jgi:hypothetical protein